MNASPHIVFAREATLEVAEFRKILVDAGLGASRPVEDSDRLRMMLVGSNLIMTARTDQPDRCLLGVARCVTDFSWCCYLSELAVSTSAQGLGIGRGLLEATRRQLGPGISLILASVPEATGFYQRAGMARIADAFWFRREH